MIKGNLSFWTHNMFEIVENYSTSYSMFNSAFSYAIPSNPCSQIEWIIPYNTYKITVILNNFRDSIYRKIFMRY